MAVSVLHADTDDSCHPFLSDPEVIQWHTLLPKYIENDMTFALDIAKRDIEKVSMIPLNKVTFENTIAAFERSGNALSNFLSLVNNLEHASNSAELREVLNVVMPKSQEFYSSVFSNDDLWARIREFSETDEAKNLNEVDKKLLQIAIDSFKENGIDLPSEQRERLKEINMELSQLYRKHIENSLDARNGWEVYVDDVSELNGLPEDVISLLADDAKANGHDGYRISSNSVRFFQLSQIKNGELRNKIFNKMSAATTNPEYDNEAVLEKMLKLRDEYAKILGYNTYADFKLQHTMLKNGDNALAFVEKLHDGILEAFEDEKHEIEDFGVSLFGRNRRYISSSEMVYLFDKNKEAMLDFDNDDVRPYFSLENVIKGMFYVANQLYGIKFIEQKTFFSEDEFAVIPANYIPVWHKDVRYFSVFEESGEYIGGLCLDLHPRRSKRDGAWSNTLREWYIGDDGKWHHPIAVVYTNLPKSTLETPSLLSQQEAETLFHEFGHALHSLFGKTKYQSISGNSYVSSDFVEMPSQFMENFCRDRASLDTFARHYITNEPIPDVLFYKMMLLDKINLTASKMMDMLCYAKICLELHHKYDEYKDTDIVKKLGDVLESHRYEFFGSEPMSSTRIGSFPHIFSGEYSAGFYSYAWSKAMAIDIFNRFKEDGVLSRKIGEEFREKVLSKGATKEPDEMFRDFIGHDPNIELLFIKK